MTDKIKEILNKYAMDSFFDTKFGYPVISVDNFEAIAQEVDDHYKKIKENKEMNKDQILECTKDILDIIAQKTNPVLDVNPRVAFQEIMYMCGRINKLVADSDDWIEIKEGCDIVDGKYLISNNHTGQMQFAYYCNDALSGWSVDRKGCYCVHITPTHYKPIPLPKENK